MIEHTSNNQGVEPMTEEPTTRANRSERGAVGTEMAIVVAIVVAIAIGLGVVMSNSASSHQECIPEAVGDEVPDECNRGDG